MLDQIRADLLRMRKSRTVRAILIGQVLLSLLMIVFMIMDNTEYRDPEPGDVVCLGVLIAFGSVVGFIMSLISISLTINEKRDGLLRNKFIIGNGKCTLFCSKVIAGYLLSVILMVIHFATVITVSAVYYNGLLPDAVTVMKIAAIDLMWMFFFSAMLAMLGLCLTSGSISIILSFGIVYALSTLPESMDARIEMVKYKGTVLLRLFKFIKSIVPYTYLITDSDPEEVSAALTGSIIPALVLSAFFIAAGCLTFRRRECN